MQALTKGNKQCICSKFKVKQNGVTQENIEAYNNIHVLQDVLKV